MTTTDAARRPRKRPTRRRRRKLGITAGKAVVLPELCRYIGPRELQALLGYSKMGLWKMRKRGDLPPATQLGPNKIGWPEPVIREWLASRPASKVKPTPSAA